MHWTPLCPGNCLYMWVKSVDVQLGTMGEGEATIFLHSFLQDGRCFAHFVNMGIVTKSVGVTLLLDSSLISLSPSWLMWPAVDCTCGPGRRASLWISGQCRKIIGPYGMNLWFEKCGKLKSKLWYGWAIANLFPQNRYKVHYPHVWQVYQLFDSQAPCDWPKSITNKFKRPGLVA